MTSKGKDGESLNRATGLLVIEVRHSNPNGDPDAESDPRTTDADGRGLISPVSLKRKLRDLVEQHEGPAWTEADATLTLTDGARRYQILESRGREREKIFAMDAKTFSDEFWDARVFGNTFLEDIKGKETKPGEKDHFISTGVVQFGAGVSVAPIEIERMTTTNKAGVEKGKDRGMAPLGWRVVRHGLYTMPFFVNPMMAAKTGCSRLDIELLKFLIPYAYSSTASASRPFVEIRHAWYAEHKSPLGSCPDHLIIDNLTPKKVKGSPDAPSTSIDEYEVPIELPAEVKKRLLPVVDLCLIEWT
jgi:Cas7 group CRISPR-associated protein Csh2